jgi:hypothetical protein
MASREVHDRADDDEPPPVTSGIHSGWSSPFPAIGGGLRWATAAAVPPPAAQGPRSEWSMTADHPGDHTDHRALAGGRASPGAAERWYHHTENAAPDQARQAVPALMQGALTGYPRRYLHPAACNMRLSIVASLLTCKNQRCQTLGARAQHASLTPLHLALYSHNHKNSRHKSKPLLPADNLQPARVLSRCPHISGEAAATLPRPQPIDQPGGGQ